jgi:hypothetical protein
MNSVKTHAIQSKVKIASDNPDTSGPQLVEQQLAYTPAAFAALLKKHPVWGYRRIYAGDVCVLDYPGRLLIPRGEVEKFLAKVTTYSGRPPKSGPATRQKAVKPQ